MDKLFTTILLVFTFISVMAQPTVNWVSNYGSSGNERVDEIKPTSDGGYLIMGTSPGLADFDVKENYGSNDIWILKIDANGDTLWTEVFGSSGNEIGDLEEAIETQDGNYLIAAISRGTSEVIKDFYGVRDILIAKMNTSGDTLWTQIMGGSDNEHIGGLDTTSNGNYIFAGVSSSTDLYLEGNSVPNAIWMVKLTPSGDTLWSRHLSNKTSNWVYDIKCLDNGNFMLTGSQANEVWIGISDEEGNIVDEYTFGGPGRDFAFEGIATKDGNYAFVGTSELAGGDVKKSFGDWDGWVVKFDASTGDTIWTQVFGYGGRDKGFELFEMNNEHIIASVNLDTSRISDGNNPLLAEISSDGDTVWTAEYGTTGFDNFGAMGLSTDGSFVLAVQSRANDGDIFTESNGNYDIQVIKFDPLYIPTAIFQPNKSIGGLNIYPNPATDRITLDGIENTQYKIISGMGKVAKEGSISNKQIPVNDLRPGIYYLQIENEGYSIFIKN